MRLSETTPSGWLRAQLADDLEHGFLGSLDELVPGLIQHDDIYGAQRLTRAVRAKELGVVARESQWEVQFLWWNSETQSNWLDGMSRAALLLDSSYYIEKARARIAHLLTTQDPDGYLGIYAPDLRFNFTGENGELWAQATLLRVLLGWYEATGDPGVLEAVQRAVAVTMRAYPPAGEAHPFDVSGDFAGVGHGLMFCDVLDRLHQLTGEAAYLEYARWLYLEYSRQPLSQDDLQLPHLLDPAYRFQAHGVHTYEQIRALLTAACAGPDPQLDAALAAALEKLAPCLTPSGGPIGDEFIGGRQADAGETGYEYCSIHELFDTYTHLLQKTGDLRWADRAEWLFFNAAQGARHPTQAHRHGIAYLKTDNSYSMTGPLHPDDPQDANNPQIRYKYSPAHQDVAVCCVPNAGRILPYYVQSMWLRSGDGLAAMLYGASTLETRVKGVPVHIQQTTQYPFDLNITFEVRVEQPVCFPLRLRLPAWASGFSLKGMEASRVSEGYIVIERTWQDGDSFTLHFDEQVQRCAWGAGEYYVRYGPLLFALPLAGEASLGRSYAAEIQDCYIAPAAGAEPEVERLARANFEIERAPFTAANPWQSLRLLAVDPNQRWQPLYLLPLGATILRRVTFPGSVT